MSLSMIPVWVYIVAPLVCIAVVLALRSLRRPSKELAALRAARDNLQDTVDAYGTLHQAVRKELEEAKAEAKAYHEAAYRNKHALDELKALKDSLACGKTFEWQDKSGVVRKAFVPEAYRQDIQDYAQSIWDKWREALREIDSLEERRKMLLARAEASGNATYATFDGPDGKKNEFHICKDSVKAFEAVHQQWFDERRKLLDELEQIKAGHVMQDGDQLVLSGDEADQLFREIDELKKTNAKLQQDLNDYAVRHMFTENLKGLNSPLSGCHTIKYPNLPQIELPVGGFKPGYNYDLLMDKTTGQTSWREWLPNTTGSYAGASSLV